MSKSMGARLPERLVAELGVEHSDKVLVLTTVDDGGSPHPALLAAASVEARGARALRVTLMTSSRTAANLALNLKDPRVKGVIFTSAMGGNDALIALPVEKIDLPVLFVHNLYDGCHVTAYDAARELYARMKNSPRRRFVTVKAAAIAEGRECGAIAAHGFRDFETATARVHVSADPVKAWDLAMETAGREHLICITSSFFIAAEMRATILNSGG